MAASQEQKVDFLLKKIGYVQSKTGIAEDASGISGTKKAPTEENKPSPLVIPSTSVWADSTFIPTSPPTSDTTYVGIYTATNAFQLTHDNTVIGNRTFIARSTFGNQSASISGDWIDPSFGTDYAVQVYKGDPNSGGVSLSPTGSGNSDEWFFDYSSGILNFNGTNVPSGITTTNVYLIGYKYIGAKGILPPAGKSNFTSLNVTGISTFVDVNVSTAITANNLIVTGSTLLSHSNSLKLQTTGIGVSVSNGIGLTATIAGPSNLIIDPGVVGDNTGIVRIKGDLFVDGTQTQINSTTLEIADFIVGVATTATSDLLTDGAGIQIGPNNTFLYEFNSGTNPSLKSSENLNVASGKVYQIDQTERLSADTLSLGTGTTIHSPASNALTFGTNGTEKVRITSDGDVGIGSVIPAGKLDVVGHTELDSVNISGVTTATTINATTFVGNGDFVDIDVDGRTELDTTNISETLNVVGITTFASNVDLNADLDVDGRTELDTTNISETLNVSGISTFENDVNVGGALSVTGNAFFVGMVTFAAGSAGNITIGDSNTDNVVFNANIDSSFIPDDTQTYDLGSSSQEWRNVFSKDIKVSTLTQNRVVFAGTNGKLQTSGNLEFIDGSQLTVGVSLTVTGSLDVDGHTELDDVNVSGASTFTGAIDANGDLDVDGHTELDNLNVSGVSTFASDIDINASIDVDGHTELDDVNVSGASTFTGAIDANGDLDVDGRTELDITNISETLNVTGISTFASDIDINASIDVDGHTELDNLNVSGVSTFVSNVNLSSNLDVDGQTDLDVLNVSETATFSSNIDANGNLDVDGQTDLDVLNVAETATFSSNIDANGDLDVDGTTELDVLNVAETATFSSNIDANGDLDVDGHTELDNLNVSGVSTFASAVDINADLDVDGRTELDITNISETLNVTGIATFANNIDANGNLDVDGTTDLDVLNVSENATFNGRIVGSATTNVIPFLYSNLSDLPSASTYHGAFAHVHATGKAYYAHAGNWIELVNKNTSGVLDVVGQTELDDLNIAGVATAPAFHTGAEGSAIRITSNTISGPSEIVIDPAAVGDNTGALRIKGDLFVDGTQTVINSTTVELADFIVGIATTATTDVLADGAGIQIGPNNTLLYDHTNTSLKSSENLNLASGKTYKIDGTDVLSATTIGSGVTNSSLTSLGTIATGVWQGTAINDDYIDTIDNANKVSLSALNIDGGTDIGAVLADGDLIIVDDGAGGTNRKADVVGITTYTFSKVSGDIVINSAGAATIQANSVALATDTTGDFVRSISGTTNEVTVSVTSGENVQPQIGLPDDVIVTTSLKVGTGITAHGGIITATTFDGTATTATNLTDGANINGGTIDDARLPDLITSNIYITSGISTFASVDLSNIDSTGIITATTFDGNINLDDNNITGNGSVNITGIITAASVEATDTVTTKILNVGTGGTVISANADTGTFAIGSATTSITATMNGGAIPSIGLVIALGG